MTNNESKTLIRALTGESLSRPPIWLMRQAGRYLPEYKKTREKAPNFLDFCYRPDLAVEVTLQPLRRYGLDAAILFSDILVVPDALGQTVKFIPDEGPVLDPIRSPDDITKLDDNQILSRLDPVFEILRRLAKEIPRETTLIGFAGAPWTVATYMVEGRSSKNYDVIRRWAYQDPPSFQRLMGILINSTATYLIEQIKNGAEVIQIFDSWAGILPEDQFDEWVIKPNKAIIDLIRSDYPDIPIIGFPRGAGVLYQKFVEETYVNGLSIDQTLPLQWAARHLQPHVTVQGNMDNVLLTVGGTAMEDAVKRILDELSGGPFIFNLGHGILPQTPPENVDRLCELVRGRG